MLSRLQKYFAACFLIMLFCASPVLAASELPGKARSSGPKNRYVRGFIINSQATIAAPSRVNTLLNFADGLFTEKKIVSPQRGVNESKWSITPVLNRMTLSSLGDHKNFGVVWKYRF